MNQWSPESGATLLMPSGPASDPDRKHLFVFLTDPIGDQELILMVCVTTMQDGHHHDDACVLEYQEHPKITHKSWVFYKLAKIVPLEKIRNGIEKKAFTPAEPVSADLFEKIEHGLKTSKFVSPRILNFFVNRP